MVIQPLSQQRSVFFPQKAQERIKWLKVANRALLMVVVVFAIWLGWICGFQRQSSESYIRPVYKQMEDRRLADDKIKPKSHYEALASRRNIFSPYQLPQKPENQIKEHQVKTTRHLKILGFLMLDQPQVIIKNHKDNVVFYLSKGDTIDGMLIENIDADSVLLTVDGFKVELQR